MKTQEQYEDLFHDLIYSILPKIDPSNIRPTWNQKEGYFGENNINEQTGEQNGLKGFTKKSNFIFFNVIQNPQVQQSETGDDGIVTVVRQITLNVIVYGPESRKNALKLSSFVKAQPGQDWCEKNNIYLNNLPNMIRDVKEPYRSEIWVRQDLEITFNERIAFDDQDEILEYTYAEKGEVNGNEVDRNETY